MNLAKSILFVLSGTMFASSAYATKCGEEVYNKRGMFRKYQALPNDISENWKKHGMSSTTQLSTEGSTASSDPGVTTGVSSAQIQSTSTKGPCKWFGAFGSIERNDYQNYVEQNLNEIKNQIAEGRGGHIEVLAEFSGCKQSATLGRNLQKHMDQFVDLKEGQGELFVDRIQNLIAADKSLANQCNVQNVAQW